VHILQPVNPNSPNVTQLTEKGGAGVRPVWPFQLGHDVINKGNTAVTGVASMLNQNPLGRMLCNPTSSLPSGYCRLYNIPPCRAPSQKDSLPAS
jgi:hypothetical protein